MKTKHQVILSGLVLLILFSSCSTINEPILNNIKSVEREEAFPNHSESTDRSNSDLIKSLFNSKIDDYYNLGYFPNVYETSLQATYYGLYILESLGKLDQINHTRIIEYIMSNYDVNSHRFVDTLAKRYLDTDFSLGYYYPLTSVLQVTCYAILSLNILNRLDLIDISGTVNFIWSCVNPGTNIFIGQKYDSDLDHHFKVSTVDNIYFAVLTLDLLMNDWTMYTEKKDSLIQFINNLQLSSGSTWDSGAFLHDNMTSFDTFQPFFEPNLLSAYYCIKTLEIFNMEDVIQVSDFNQFLNHLYDSKNDCFKVSEWDYGLNYSNIVATAIGLELSEINSFSSINRSEVLSFLLNNRNQYGSWDGSTLVSQHELIDTFQIIRSLQNLDEISNLSLTIKNEIGNATQLHYQDKGYSHLSRDYTSINHIYSIVSSFRLFDRVSELNIQELYTQIRDSYNYVSRTSNSFSGYLLKDQGFYLLRSHPIEFFCSGRKVYLDEVAQMNSHKSTYYALESLQQIYKLNDFDSDFDAKELLDDIITTQFLNSSYYDSFGAFTPVYLYDVSRSEYLNKKIYSEYSYWAVRCMEILSDFLGLGGLNNLTFDSDALYNYIDRNMVETSSQLYFKPHHTSNTEKILENTYYMIYILKALDLFTKDPQKIKTYVTSHLDYTNMENLYYSYKISEILDLDITFNAEPIQKLVQTIFNDDFREFYRTSQNMTLDHDVFLWICEMARYSKIEINANYENIVPLGGYNNISVSLYNLILKEFGSYISFKFESSQIGTYTFNKISEEKYCQNIKIPYLLENYPEITGNLTAYEGGIEKKAEMEITFQTGYSLVYSLSIENNKTVSIDIKSTIVAHTNYSLTYGDAYIDIYTQGVYNFTKYFTHVNHSAYSLFSLTYTPSADNSYVIKIFLNDGFSMSPLYLGNITNQVEIIDNPPTDDNKNNNNEIFFKTFPVMIVLITMPGSAIILTTRKLNKVEKGQKPK